MCWKMSEWIPVKQGQKYGFSAYACLSVRAKSGDAQAQEAEVASRVGKKRSNFLKKSLPLPTALLRKDLCIRHSHASMVKIPKTFSP